MLLQLTNLAFKYNHQNPCKSSVLSREKILPRIISFDQTGFSGNQYSFFNIRRQQLFLVVFLNPVYQK